MFLKKTKLISWFMVLGITFSFSLNLAYAGSGKGDSNNAPTGGNTTGRIRRSNFRSNIRFGKSLESNKSKLSIDNSENIGFSESGNSEDSSDKMFSLFAVPIESPVLSDENKSVMKKDSKIVRPKPKNLYQIDGLEEEIDDEIKEEEYSNEFFLPNIVKLSRILCNKCISGKYSHSDFKDHKFECNSCKYLSENIEKKVPIDKIFYLCDTYGKDYIGKLQEKSSSEFDEGSAENMILFLKFVTLKQYCLQSKMSVFDLLVVQDWVKVFLKDKFESFSKMLNDLVSHFGSVCKSSLSRFTFVDNTRSRSLPLLA